MDQDHSQRTIRTYDEIARDYHMVDTTERRATKEAHADRFVAHAPGLDILVVGCGLGADSRYIQGAGMNVTSIDLSVGMLTRAVEADTKGRYKLMDMRDIRRFTEPFDGIWASACIYHLTEIEIKQWLLDANATLRPGGILYISVKELPTEGFRERPAQNTTGGPVAAERLIGDRWYSALRWSVFNGWAINAGFVCLERHMIADDPPAWGCLWRKGT